MTTKRIAGVNNIIIVVVDALRAKNLGCYGYPVNTTPNIDRWAQRGLLFKDAYACSPSTDPSFTSIATGLYPPSHGITKHGKEINKEETQKLNNIPFLAEILKRQGFRTFGLDFLSRWHRRGFDYYTGMEGSHKSKFLSTLNSVRDRLGIRPGSKLQKWIEGTSLYRFVVQSLFSSSSTPYLPADKLTDMAIEILKNHPEDKLFIFLHYWDPHQPYYSPQKYIDRLATVEYDGLYPNLDKTIEEMKAKICHPFVRSMIEQTTKDKRDLVSIIRSYDGEVSFVDEQFDRLMKTADEMDLLDETLVIFTADHGESLTEHEVYFNHARLYNEVLHIPFILWHPAFPGGEVSGFVQPVDILPTVLDMSGIDCDYKFDRESVGSIVKGTGDIRSWCFAIIDNSFRKGMTLFTKEYKYIATIGEEGHLCEYCGRSHWPREELYDLVDDPDEINNIVARHKQIAKKYRKDLEERVRQFNQFKDDVMESKEDFVWSEEEKEEVEKRLRDLGYL